MKKLIFILSVLMLLICCKSSDKIKEKIKYYPSERFFNNVDLVEIDLDDSTLNFKKIFNIVINSYSQEAVPYVSLKSKDTLKKIIVLRSDEGFISSRNALRIQRDSIFLISQDYPLKVLPKILKLHYENNGKNMLLSQRSDLAFIELIFDKDDTPSQLKESLLILIKAFDKLNEVHADSLELKVTLNYGIPKPPIPPTSE